MKLEPTELTPELAAQLLANPYEKQRRPARVTVDMYARAIKEGRWRLVGDPILVDSKGQMFNGAHRCAAVIAAHRSIPVMISWDADPATFDLIDIGRKRSAYQFITATDATARASAARVTLWYEKRFERPLQPQALTFDLHEVMAEVERRQASFDAMLVWARTTYENTSIPVSVSLAAYAIAFDFGYQEQVEAFVMSIEDPVNLDPTDPARLLADRFRKQVHRGKRRQLSDDWTILVRALNLCLEGRTASRLVLSEFWPRVAESEAEFTRRRNAVTNAAARDNDAARYHKKEGVA